MIFKKIYSSYYFFQRKNRVYYECRNERGEDSQSRQQHILYNHHSKNYREQINKKYYRRGRKARAELAKAKCYNVNASR
jgi:hypothetical protein